MFNIINYFSIVRHIYDITNYPIVIHNTSVFHNIFNVLNMIHVFSSTIKPRNIP